MGTSIRVSVSLLLLLSALVLGFSFWEELQKTLQLTYEHRSLNGTPLKSVTIYRNGYSTGGVQMQLSAELLAARTNEGELAAYLSQFIAVEGLHESVTQNLEDADESKDKEHDVPGVVADRAFNGRGELVQTYSDIVSGDKIYLVAPGLLFVWPFVELGHRVAVMSKASPTIEPVIIESISESPRVFRVHNFFSSEEADKLVQRTLEIDDPEYKLQRSTVVADLNKSLKSRERTSENAFDTDSETSVNIRKRASDILSLGEHDVDTIDGLQLLRYQQKQAYIAHHDYFPVNNSSDFNFDSHKGGSNRFATVFLYLSNVTRGGQTVFPLVEMPEGLPVEYGHPLDAAQSYEAAGAELFEPDSWEMKMVKDCSTKLAFYPSKGGAVLFYSQKPNGELDSKSFHGGCPVLEGTKWGANLWIWNKRRFGSSECEVIFKNPTSREVSVYWSSTHMGTLEANGGSISFTSYLGHKWVVKDGDHTLLEFIVGAECNSEQIIIVPPLEEKPTEQPNNKATAKAKTSDEADARDEL